VTSRENDVWRNGLIIVAIARILAIHPNNDIHNTLRCDRMEGSHPASG